VIIIIHSIVTNGLQIRWLLAEHHVGLSQNNTLVTIEGFYDVVKGYQPNLQALLPLVSR